MNLTSLIMKGLAPRAKAFEASTKHPLEAQKRTLLKYLHRNRTSEYGLKYGFSAIKSIEDFRSRLPIVDYNKMKAYIDRMKNGEENILTSDKVRFFGITSGTTGEPKFIPVTKYSQARKADLMNLWAYYTCTGHPSVFDGNILGIISPEVKSFTSARIPYGPEDGHAYNNLPEIMKRLYVLPYELFYIDDYDARYYCILRIAVEHNVTTIATLNPSTLVLLMQKLPFFTDRIIYDIEHGTLDRSINIPEDIRWAIEEKLRPNPKRANLLKVILKERGKLLPKYFWPKLDLIECWKGGTVKFYIKMLPEYFGDVAIRDFGCLSTEARSSVPMSDEGASGVLGIQTNFYEFIPKEDMSKVEKRVLLCNEVEPGKEYLLIVTTPGGLYRYNIDDIVRVDGFFNKTPTIEFVQKGQNAVSITGEKIYESHIVEAVNIAVAKYHIPVRSFCASAVTEGTPRYVFMVEFEGKPSAGEKHELLGALEDELRLQNSEYDDLRKQQLILAPSLKVVKPGEFERYRRERVRQGAHDTQFKMPKLSRDGSLLNKFEVLEEIFMDA